MGRGALFKVPRTHRMALSSNPGVLSRICQDTASGKQRHLVERQSTLAVEDNRLMCRSESQLEAEQESYARLLKATGNSRDIAKGKQLHYEIICSEHCHSRFLGNLLIEMYGKCGCVNEAKTVFDKLQHPNVYSWNIMMAAYTQNGHLREASDMFIKTPQRDVVSWTTMVTAYAQYGHLHEARRTFDKMPRKNLVSWNAMIAGYVQNGHDKEAVALFHAMDQDGAGPNQFTLASILDAYGNLGDLARGKLTHARIVKCGVELDVVIRTALIIMYGKCRRPEEARKIFERLPEEDLIASTAMIAAYAQNGQLQEAASVFSSLPKRDVVSWTGMLTAYAQNGQLQEARKIFDTMPHQNVVTWSAMIAAYAQGEEGKEAIKLFKLMDLEGEYPHNITIVSLVDACSAVAELAQAKLIHSVIEDNGFHLDVVVASALINMYGKCGSLKLARDVFEQMPQRNEVTWNTIITVYAEDGSGHGTEALYMFMRMQLEGVQPNEISIAGALVACSHAGLLEDARYYFGSLSREYGIALTADSYMCMIDLLGRAGRLKEAEDLINCMPYEPEVVTWMTLLGACKTHEDAERGARIGKRILELDPEYSGPYVLLSNVYSSGGEAEQSKELSAWDGRTISTTL